MNRVVINMDPQGFFTVHSDEEIEFFVVCDHCPNDRVYQMGAEIGPDKVRAQLRDDMIGHRNDSQPLGNGYGPRKPPSRRKFKVVE